MRDTSPKRQRLTEVSHCCGFFYRRWRLVGHIFRSGLTQCRQCQKPLRWLKTDGTNRSASWRYYLRKRQRHLRQGLTAHGHCHVRPRPLFRTQARVKNRLKFRRLSARRAAQGLTTRGTPRKYNLVGNPLNPRERAWNDLRASMGIRLPDVFDHLHASDASV